LRLSEGPHPGRFPGARTPLSQFSADLQLWPRGSPRHLQPKLDLTRRGRRVIDQSGAWRKSGRGECGRQRKAEVRPVQQIEELGTELDIRPLGDVEGLEQG